MDIHPAENGPVRRPRGRVIAIAIAVAVVVVLGANAAVAVAVFATSHHEATDWPGRSFTFWPERDWRQIDRRVKALPSTERLSTGVLGEVRYRQGTYPVHIVRSTAIRGDGRPLRVLLVSGMHGTETAGPEALLRLAESLAADPGLFPGVTIDIVPVANPWGWIYGYRYNGDGEDVNRDFASHRTQEARLIQGLLRRDGPFDLVMDLHESKKYGYFIYKYEPAGRGLAAEYVRILAAMGKPRENAYSEWIFPARDGVLSTPATALFWIAMGRSLSLDHYARLRGTEHSYTVETPVRDAFDDRVAVHQRTVRTFISRLAESRTGR
jgi:hypothetical protein